MGAYVGTLSPTSLISYRYILIYTLFQYNFNRFGTLFQYKKFCFKFTTKIQQIWIIEIKGVSL